MARGRPGKKDEICKHKADIEKWAAEGLTMGQIAKKLGVSESTLYKYKAELPELSETVKKGRREAVAELENMAFKAAKGYTLTVTKHQKVKRIEYEDGKKKLEKEEMVEYEEEVYFPPNPAFNLFLLKNWGKYSNEPETVKLRKKEVELRKKQIEEGSWS